MSGKTSINEHRRHRFCGGTDRRWTCTGRGRLVVMAFVMALVCGNLSGAWAQEVPEGFEQGQITGLFATRIQIDGTDYRLAEGLVVRDEVGRPWSLRDVGSGVRIFFHLESGLVNEIIVVLPR